MPSADIKQQIKESLKRLEQLAEKAEQASMFTALDAAKELAREQLKFNQLIGEILCQ